MLKDNIQQYRKRKGLTQEELALSLHVVRQTISKWEKGLSVPDSEQLISLARELDVTVAMLLGESEEEMMQETEDRREELQRLARSLDEINLQLAESQKVSRRWKLGGCAAVFGVSLLMGVRALLQVSRYLALPGQSVIGGMDGPTQILVTTTGISWWRVGVLLGVMALSAVGVIYWSRKRG